MYKDFLYKENRCTHALTQSYWFSAVCLGRKLENHSCVRQDQTQDLWGVVATVPFHIPIQWIFEHNETWRCCLDRKPDKISEKTILKTHQMQYLSHWKTPAWRLLTESLLLVGQEAHSVSEINIAKRQTWTWIWNSLWMIWIRGGKVGVTFKCVFVLPGYQEPSPGISSYTNYTFHSIPFGFFVVVFLVV